MTRNFSLYTSLDGDIDSIEWLESSWMYIFKLILKQETFTYYEDEEKIMICQTYY